MAIKTHARFMCVVTLADINITGCNIDKYVQSIHSFIPLHGKSVRWAWRPFAHSEEDSFVWLAPEQPWPVCSRLEHPRLRLLAKPDIHHNLHSCSCLNHDKGKHSRILQIRQRSVAIKPKSQIKKLPLPYTLWRNFFLRFFFLKVYWGVN